MKLRPYQVGDLDFFNKRKHCANFSEPRTGKTPVALQWAEGKAVNKMLVITTGSSLYQWANECLKWTNNILPFVADEYRYRKEKTIQDWIEYTREKPGLLIMSYDSLKLSKKSRGFIDTIVCAQPNLVIIDEAHRIKNVKTSTTQSIMNLKHTEYKMAMTGTPAPNRKYEIWPILHWLFPDLYKNYYAFINTYFKTITRRTKEGRRYKEIGDFKYGMDMAIVNILDGFSVQHKRKEVMPWLPDKDVIDVYLDPSTEQERYLTELEDYFETEHVVTKGILDRLIRYRQVCLAPKLLDLKGTSPKLNWLKEYLKDYPDRPTIVFSKFTSFIKIIEKELANEKIGVIIGATPPKERDDLKNAFQNGEINLLLLNIDTAKEALTLDRAEVAIFTDKYPPAGDIAQAEDRFVATTEDKANKPSIIYNLILSGTYDESIYELVLKRAEETDIINNYINYLKERKKHE